MTRPSASLTRRSLAAAAAAAGLVGVVPGTGVAAARHPASQRSSCPAAESLVPGTTWHRHRLANGVHMAAGTARDSRGLVNMHVLSVDLTNPRVSLQPLERGLGHRLPLSQLAAHHRRLVAATNTGYFDFQYGAPTVPLIVGGRAQVLSTRPQPVVGINRRGRMQAGLVWETGTVTVGSATQRLSAVDEPYPPSGLALFNDRWGSGNQVPGSYSDRSRDVVGGTVSAAAVPHRGATVPRGGYLLQARGQTATSWLDGTTTGQKVTIASRVQTNAASPFVQAYGVGVQIVSTPGVVKTGFSCDSANTKTPARTAIGWTNGGRTLIMAVVADHPHTSVHGLDEDQMSELMVQLGASRAFAFDGSGSSELLAKLRGSSSLVRQTYPADGVERPMPLGLGIAVAPPRRHHHHK